MEKQDVDDNIPFIVRFYIGLYDRIPKCRLPGTKLEFGFTMFWMMIFCIVRWLSMRVFVWCGWPSDSTSTFAAVSSFIGGYLHAPQVVLLSHALITSQQPHYNPSAVSTKTPPWWNKATDCALQICTAYMIYDFFFLLKISHIGGKGIDVDTILLLLHHFVTTFYMTTSRIFEAGQSSALTCIFLGEFTNTSFNTYCIIDKARKSGVFFSPFYSNFFPIFELFTASLYLLFRLLLSPVILSYVSYSLLTDVLIRPHVPALIRAIWIFLMAAVLVGSMKQNMTFLQILKGSFLGWNIISPEL
jgi:hypothetical protein